MLPYSFFATGNFGVLTACRENDTEAMSLLSWEDQVMLMQNVRRKKR